MLYLPYAAALEGSARQANFGKALLGLRVVDEGGQRLSSGQSWNRNGYKLVSAAVLALGFVWILFDRRRQGWHDKLAKTYVVEG